MYYLCTPELEPKAKATETPKAKSKELERQGVICNKASVLPKQPLLLDLYITQPEMHVSIGQNPCQIGAFKL